MIITSDHGYVMPGEHGNYEQHATNLYEGTVRIPLIIRYPAKIPAKTVIDNLVRSIDIAPTILELLDYKRFPEFQGVNLLPLIQGKEMEPLIAYAEGICHGPERKMIRTSNYKYIYIPEMLPQKIEELIEFYSKDIEINQRELYHLEDDPWEGINLIEEKPETVSTFQTMVDQYILAGNQQDAHASDNIIELSGEEIERLRNLGYIK